MDWNTNLFWCIIGVIGGAIVSTFFYLINIKRKRLLCIINTTPIVYNKISKLKGVTISHDNKPIHALYVTKIDIKNIGNSIIEPSDFAPVEPLYLITSGTFFTDENSSSKIKTNKNFNNAHVTYVNDRTNKICIKSVINFDYIAKKETITITLFHSDEIYFHGKLKDGKIIKNERENQKMTLTYMIFSTFITILSCIIMSLFANLLYTIKVLIHCLL